jgi:hypothetical protein
VEQYASFEGLSLLTFILISKNWDVLTSTLLSDDEELDERKQTLLVRLVNVCIKKACGKPICPKTRQETEKPHKKVICSRIL